MPHYWVQVGKNGQERMGKLRHCGERTLQGLCGRGGKFTWGRER